MTAMTREGVPIIREAVQSNVDGEEAGTVMGVMPRGKQVALLSALKLQATRYRERREDLVHGMLMGKGGYHPERWEDVHAVEMLIAGTDGAIALLRGLLEERRPDTLLSEPRALAWFTKQEEAWQQRSWQRLRDRLVPEGHTLKGLDEPASAAD